MKKEDYGVSVDWYMKMIIMVWSSYRERSQSRDDSERGFERWSFRILVVNGDSSEWWRMKIGGVRLWGMKIFFVNGELSEEWGWK